MTPVSTPAFLEKFLTPINDEFPAGLSVAYTPLYEAIREARKSEPELEEKAPGVWVETIPKRDWNSIRKNCELLLCTQSKDLQVAAWLCEALFFLEGLAGLLNGLEILCALSNRFWIACSSDTPEDGPLSVAPYEWLEYHMPAALLNVEITTASSPAVNVYTWSDWVDALHWEGVRQRGGESVSSASAPDRPLVADLLQGVQKTPETFYEDIVLKSGLIMDVLGRLEDFLKAQLQEDPPFFRRFKEKLGLLKEHLHTWQSHAFVSKLSHAAKVSQAPCLELESGADDAQVSDETLEDEDSWSSWDEESPVSSPQTKAPQTKAPQTKAPQTKASFGDCADLNRPEWAFESREQAYTCLSHVAHFLALHDPHSPTPYLLQRVLSWQYKTLPDIYEECSQDPQTFSLLMDLLQVS